MPFDHARCPNCTSILDPERLIAGTRGPACPKCGTQLSMVDLFGVSDAFREDEQPDLTLEDLMPGLAPSRKPEPRDEDLTLDHLIRPTTKRLTKN